MKFYNRENELETLQKVRETAFAQHSKLTVLTGRRRIGKTNLFKNIKFKTNSLFIDFSRFDDT
ncbi:MAG: hypothetical protein EZS26_003068 [Candidatus Ordinivivax streblomastigis]|uniref:ATP-binding protein n=1 Tax=Candidatus Ordinivivax streblomastigis TaxID=2540710 RepID=A0A5M8NVA5_9BACT|nr:MAG: hypothetical protein EZS26_003068 [Candidatus Ordinivivax streblomastigis]